MAACTTTVMTHAIITIIVIIITIVIINIYQYSFYTIKLNIPIITLLTLYYTVVITCHHRETVPGAVVLCSSIHKYTPLPVQYYTDPPLSKRIIKVYRC